MLSASSLVAGLVACSAAKDGAAAGYDLGFSRQKYTERNLEVSSQGVKFRTCEGIVYVRNPVDTKYEIINIYVPEAYYSGGSAGGSVTETAPVFFPSQVDGYMPVGPGKPGFGRGGEASQTPSAVLTALSEDYVVAPPGARGRAVANGKAPAAIVDLKATVRYLKFNDRAMPRDADKIVSNRTSAGGALSAPLGMTGNSRDYGAHLKVLGAAGGGDDVFTVPTYCPITDLDRVGVARE